jgi:hypothetical protein
VNCPRCGGSSRILLAPGFFRCTSEIFEEQPTGAHPSGAFGPTFRVISYVCGFEYQEGTGQAGQSLCAEHALFAVGVCSRCRTAPVCGRCPQQKCRVCRQAEERAAIRQRAEEADRYLAAAEATATKETRQKRARETAHAAAVRANAAVHPGRRDSYIRELNKLQGKFPVEYPTKPYWFKRSPFLAVIWMIFFAGLSVALVHGTSQQPAATKLAVFGGFLFGVFVWFGGLRALWTAYAKARNASLDARREALFRALGCGKNCEFGCRTGVKPRAERYMYVKT